MFALGMADFLLFNPNTNDSPNISRALINKNMNPDVANLKKRKLLPGVTGDVELPEPKHKCYEAVVDSEYDSSSITVMVTKNVLARVDSEQDISSVLNNQMESTQDSNSFHGDSQSVNVDIKVDAGLGNTDSYAESSTTWDQSDYYPESSNRRERKDDNEDTGWHDIDGLDDCISGKYCEDSIGQTTEGLHELLSSSGVDPNIFALSSEETQPGRPKPTIDQEFEQYFSMLML